MSDFQTRFQIYELLILSSLPECSRPSPASDNLLKWILQHSFEYTFYFRHWLQEILERWSLHSLLWTVFNWYLMLLQHSNPDNVGQCTIQSAGKDGWHSKKNTSKPILSNCKLKVPLWSHLSAVYFMSSIVLQHRRAVCGEWQVKQDCPTMVLWKVLPPPQTQWLGLWSHKQSQTIHSSHSSDPMSCDYLCDHSTSGGGSFQRTMEGLRCHTFHPTLHTTVS